MPSPGKGYCDFRQIEVTCDQCCDYFERIEDGKKEAPARCPHCSHFLKKTCSKKNSKDPQKDKNKH